MPCRQVRRMRRITCTERAPGMWRLQSLSIDCPPSLHALCRPLPGWSCVHSGIAHWMPPLLSSGLEPSFRRAIAQHNMRIRGRTGPRQQKHSGTSLQYTCPAQRDKPGSTTCPAQHTSRHCTPILRLSALCVVPREGYLAYLCSSVPDTPSSAVGIPRSIHAISGIHEHR